MKKWFTSSELSGLPGMPKTERGVTLKAKRERYIARYRRGRGGGKEYHIETLPDETKAAACFKDALPAARTSVTDIITKEGVKQDLTALKQWQREILTARIVLYREFERLQALMGTNRAVDQLVLMAKNRALPEHIQKHVERANARKGDGRTLSRSMVLGWHRKVKRQGIGGLAPKPAAGNRIPEWAPYFIQSFQRPQKPSIPEAMAEMAKILPEHLAMPSYH